MTIISEYNDWIDKLSSSISKKIDELKRKQITGMSVMNLMQMVEIPRGGPEHLSNIVELYRDKIFPEAVSRLSTSKKKFVIGL